MVSIRLFCPQNREVTNAYLLYQVTVAKRYVRVSQVQVLPLCGLLYAIPPQLITLIAVPWTHLAHCGPYNHLLSF